MQEYLRERSFDIRTRLYEYSTQIIRNWRVMLLLVIFASGVMFGAKLASGGSGAGFASYAEEYIEKRTESSVLTVFLRSFFLNSGIIAAGMISGLCAVGMPLICILPCIKGISAGLICGYMYRTFAIKGLGYCALTIFPSAIFCSLIIIISCNESVLMSGDSFGILLLGKPTHSREEVKVFLLHFLIYVLTSLFCAVAEALLNRAFSGLFL